MYKSILKNQHDASLLFWTLKTKKKIIWWGIFATFVLKNHIFRIIQILSCGVKLKPLTMQKGQNSILKTQPKITYCCKEI